MGDKPIIFSAPMVRALLDGRKTQTRRLLKVQPPEPCEFAGFYSVPLSGAFQCRLHGNTTIYTQRLPYAVGDRLYVREAWRCSAKHDATPPRDLMPRSMTIAYEAGGSIANQDSRDDWRPSEVSYTEADWMGRFRQGMHMPRWASRLTLSVTDVRVQRLQDISADDAEAEGCECDTDGWRDYLFPSTQCCGTARESYRTLWNSLHGPDAWDANPWVVAVSFTVQHGNIDQLAQVAK